MINSIISFSIKNKALIGLMTIGLIIGGIYSMTKVPLDATPDITNNQVLVITTAPNLGTEDIEQFVTYQVELAVANLPDVTEIRSVSRFGLSVVTIVFKESAGTYLPRQLVSEALAEVKEKIPQGFGEPFMAPISTGLGEIYQYTLEVQPGYDTVYNDMELRTMQEWIVKRQMAMLPGVVEVNSFGGRGKQYEVAVNPDKLRSMGLAISDIFEALDDNNQNTGGAYIEKNFQANFIRGEGLMRSLDDIKNTLVANIDGQPIFIRDVAEVKFGSFVRYGAFTKDGKGEAVGGIVMMLKGENSNDVIKDVKERMALIQKSLPDGVVIKPFLDRSKLIKITAVIGGNVKEIKVFHGDKVRKGQLLAVLEHPDYIKLQEDFAEVANRLEFLEQEFERQKELFENNVGAGQDFQQAKAEYNTAKAKYEGLKSRLQLLNLSPDKIMQGNISNTININSPINGFVNEVNIKVGSYVDAKDILLEITDNTAIHADFMVYEKDVHLVKEGQKVHFTVSNRPDEELTATVFAIGKEFEANSRAVHIHAKINEKVSGLIPGMYISGHLHTDEKYTRALPNDAIVTEGTKSYIFILDKQAVEKHAEEENHEGHEHGDEDDDDAKEEKMAFRMVEVLPGLKDEGYTEVQLINPLPENTQVVMNAAYYLLADMKKEETEHEH